MCIKFIKKITVILLISAILSIILQFSSKIKDKSANAVNLGSGAVVIEQSSKRVLYAENADLKLYPASTTKVLTALTVIENVLDLNRRFKISDSAVGVEGSSIYLAKGEEYSYLELLYGLMLRSGNDAAVALAVETSGSVEKFVSLMNDTAKKCGAINSNFVNPNGLHDDRHVTTAYDLALITARAYEYDVFKKIVSAKSYTTSHETPKYFYNKNKMLGMYEGANGVKTGYTKASGRCLISGAKRNGMQLISVVLNHGDMWNDSVNMLTNAFNEYEMRDVVTDEPTFMSVSGGKLKMVQLMPKQTFSYPLTDKEFDELRFETDAPECITAPVREGKAVYTVKVFSGNRLLFQTDFYTMHNIERRTPFDKLFGRASKEYEDDAIKQVSCGCGRVQSTCSRQTDCRR
jgi:D-alanyl-D-alanine carboxypeptidase